MAAEEKKSKPVMDDVAKPGDTPAEATSRPLIVGKGPAIKDPMVNEATSAEKTEDKPLRSPSAVKKVINPIVVESDGKENPTPAKATEPEPPVEPSEELVTDQTEEADKVTPEVDKTTEEDLKRQDLANKLIADKTYFVPIGAVKQKKKNRIIVVFLIVLVLGVLGAVAAVDAELIDSNITLPFDLIK